MKVVKTSLQNTLICLVVFALVAGLSGCSTILPSTQVIPRSKWTTFDEAKNAFAQITPLQTKVSDLTALGFDPYAPNAKTLTYLDIIQRFVPNQSITKEDLDLNIRDCIESKDHCQAIELDLNQIRSQRVGNVCLDIFGFRRKTHETGWRFTALLVIRDETVVYKLFSGQPIVDRYERKIKPLGPFQELENLLGRSISIGH